MWQGYRMGKQEKGNLADKIWNCLRIFPRRCNWNLAKTQFEIVLEYFRGDVIGIWLRHNLKLSQNIFEEM